MYKEGLLSSEGSNPLETERREPISGARMKEKRGLVPGGPGGRQGPKKGKTNVIIKVPVEERATRSGGAARRADWLASEGKRARKKGRGGSDLALTADRENAYDIGQLHQDNHDGRGIRYQKAKTDPSGKTKVVHEDRGRGGQTREVVPWPQSEEKDRRPNKTFKAAD